MSDPEVTCFSAPPFDHVEDLVGDPVAAGLVLLAAGNQFMVVPDLLASFAALHRVPGGVFCETLPPGVLAQQVRTGRLEVGSLVLSVVPDVVALAPEALHALELDGLVGPARAYASNGLSLLVAPDNPLGLRGWADLARPEVRIALPDAATEGIGALALDALVMVGGEGLARLVRETKEAAGATRMTSIHHRQGPAWLVDGAVDAAVVWSTEARHHVARGAAVQEVRPVEGDLVRGTYACAVARSSRHPEAAEAFVDFLTGPEARVVYAAHGFDSA